MFICKSIKLILTYLNLICKWFINFQSSIWTSFFELILDFIKKKVLSIQSFLIFQTNLIDCNEIVLKKELLDKHLQSIFLNSYYLGIDM